MILEKLALVEIGIHVLLQLSSQGFLLMLKKIFNVKSMLDFMKSIQFS
jgi:hypothetical protein